MAPPIVHIACVSIEMSDTGIREDIGNPCRTHTCTGRARIVGRTDYCSRRSGTSTGRAAAGIGTSAIRRTSTGRASARIGILIGTLLCRRKSSRLLSFKEFCIMLSDKLLYLIVKAIYIRNSLVLLGGNLIKLSALICLQCLKTCLLVLKVGLLALKCLALLIE